jgi:hypothetical protein
MVANGDATHVNLDEFLKLLVERRRLQRFFDSRAGICTLVDLETQKRFCIDILSLQRLSTR